MKQTEARPIRIQIVEDEAIIASMLAESLESMGYTVTGIADTGVKAIMEFFAGEPDLILMDIRLKGPMDGIEAAERIRSQRAVPIVFLTANQDPATFERAKIEGAFGYVLKPYQERELQITIEIALSQFQAKLKRTQLERALDLSERLSAVGVLASGILHDVKAPLSVVQAGTRKISSFLQEKGPCQGHAQLDDGVRSIEKGISSILEAIDVYGGMLGASETEEPSFVDLKEVCRSAMEICRYSATGQGVVFRELKGEDQTFVWMGKRSLFQVLVNLIRNACDAMEKTPDAWLEISWEKAKDTGWLELRVTDSGPGVANAIRDKIFEPLFTTKSPEKGTGLGLSLCKMNLERFGGGITLEEGSLRTTFKVTLKLAP